MLGLLIWLIGYRAIHRLAGDVTPRALLGLAAASATATAMAEATWHAAATGVDPLRLLAAHFDVTNGLRPAGWVFLAGLAAAVAAARWRLVPQASMARTISSNAASGSARGQSPS
jgi:methionine sulfoxide reductase heme-binding subunit